MLTQQARIRQTQAINVLHCIPNTYHSIDLIEINIEIRELNYNIAHHVYRPSITTLYQTARGRVRLVATKKRFSISPGS
jgi:hypothetical protein